ncbi:MAG: orotidine-5'-phosphate decarboxylase [Deltaproteobacteria bacterium]|nr:orotidine-5'-phosphate decarboxylase [Deltaproteobacteria bacterium]
MTKLIISLETKDFKETRKFVREIGGLGTYYKVGLPLFVKEGPPVVKWLKDQGKQVFLDLKFFDIPTVTIRSLEAGCELGVFMINFHTVLSSKNLDEIAKLKKCYPKVLFIGVTLLTSFSQSDLIEEGFGKWGESLEERVVQYSERVRKAGLDGVVCSAWEVPSIKKVCGKDFITVTPGIRLDSGTPSDQSRVTTVKKACELGADYLVIGRPIHEASPKKALVKKILSML